MRTGRDGYACAHAKRETADRTAAPPVKCNNFLRGSFMAASLVTTLIIPP
jgi:hypothetical protein